MDEKEFSEFLSKIFKLKPDQLEQMFVCLADNFRCNRGKDINYPALAWRCKQAYQIIQHRTPPKSRSNA
jgi:hypothetical protein